MLNSKLLNEIFEDDGSYRDLYISDVEIKDWETILELIKNNFEFKFLKDSDEIDINLYDAARIFRDKSDFAFLISIDYKGVIINTHFLMIQKLSLIFSQGKSTAKRKEWLFLILCGLLQYQ